MTDDNQAPWDTMLRGLVDGDGQAYAEFWDRYGERLNRIANRHLPRQLHRRVQPEDVVQSVCRTFFRRMSEGRFELGKNEQLWPLLCAITLNKVRMQIRFQLQGKRHVAREVRFRSGEHVPGKRDTTAGSAGGTTLTRRKLPHSPSSWNGSWRSSMKRNDRLFNSDWTGTVVRRSLSGCNVPREPSGESRVAFANV